MNVYLLTLFGSVFMSSLSRLSLLIFSMSASEKKCSLVQPLRGILLLAPAPRDGDRGSNPGLSMPASIRFGMAGMVVEFSTDKELQFHGVCGLALLLLPPMLIMSILLANAGKAAQPWQLPAMLLAMLWSLLLLTQWMTTGIAGRSAVVALAP